MTARSIRRAQERKARKLARKQANASEKQPDTTVIPKQSPERSDGLDDSSRRAGVPVTAAAAPARLSLETFTAQTGPMLLPASDAHTYERHLKSYRHEFQPVTLLEKELVESAANADWRILRYHSIEMAFYVRGRSEFAAKFEQEDPAARAALCDVETFVVYGKQIRHLELQENRLHRQREKDLAELRALQEARVQAAAGFEFSTDDEAALLGELKTPSNEAALLSELKTPSDEAAVLSEPKIQNSGFEFSEEQCERYFERVAAANLASVIHQARPNAAHSDPLM